MKHRSCFSVLAIGAIAFCAATVGPLSVAAALPTQSSTLFSGSGNCAICHASNGQANTENGIDISPVSQWRSTMMANAARDPLWRAKVSAELATFPALQEAIETKCTRCHAPLGNAEAAFHGASGYSIAEMTADPLALDGVSCTLCHQIQPDNLGLPGSYSGHFDVDDSHQIYGPYPDPLVGPMRGMSGYTPVQAGHTSDSELCATCHTLFTAHVNDQGEFEGSFPEQTPYLEWKNSRFQDDGIECQTCHMPVSPSAVDIATMPGWHRVLRSPFSYHTMVGANVFMLSILRDNIEELGLNATVAQFDSSIVRTRRMLATETVSLSETHGIDGDTVFVDVHVENLAGHKLPTGIPLRRMWLYFRATDDGGNTIFESGAWDDRGEVAGLDPGYEPHHDVIVDSDQVQIYETILEDAHGDLTWTLLSAAAYRKDNRLPPQGFTTTAAVYDSVRIEGAALNDDDFNLGVAGEGTGADIVHYRFPRPPGGTVAVVAMACYQTLPPRVFAHLNSHDTPEVHLFSGMYSAADKSPVILGSLEFTVDATSGVDSPDVPAAVHLSQNIPNPFNPTTLISYEIDADREILIVIHDVKGRLVRTLFAGHQPSGTHAVVWDGTDEFGAGVSSGTYLYTLVSGSEKISRRMVLVR